MAKTLEEKKAIARERSRLWHQANKERAHANAKRWREQNLERHRELSRAWQAANPDRFRELKRKSTRAWVERNQRKIPVEYACPICGTNEPGRWHRDHDPRFGYWDKRGWREILCNGCNTGGKLTDSIPLLQAKIDYLRKHTERIDALVAAESAERVA